MSCQDEAANGVGYKYSHGETATIRLYPSSSSATDTDTAITETPPWALNSRVSIESSSTLQSSTPLFQQYHGGDSWSLSSDVASNGTPFSKPVLDLLSRYPLQRLLIRVGDAASSSTSGNSHIDSPEWGSADAHEQQLLQEERARGPSGTSVEASFVQSHLNGDGQTKEFYQNQYASLLRYLLDRNLFPPCGAPLDSVRVRKHGHSTIVHSPDAFSTNETQYTMQTVDVESFLAADAATFCNSGIQTFMLSGGGKGGGWGSATNNGACHQSDNWGLFDSLFSSSSGAALSELLLGSSLDASPWVSNGRGDTNKRNSVWIEMQVSPSCFDSDLGGECSVKVTRGASYRVALPYPTPAKRNDEKQTQLQTLNVSLGDLLLGHNALEYAMSSEEGGWKAWYPCPMSDSSRILMYMPTGYAAALNDGVSIGFDSDAHAGKMELDVFAWKDHIDLAAPWAQIHHANENSKNDQVLLAPTSPLFGISRTVQRPLGVSSSGTLVTALRYDQSESEQTGIVEVQSLDILPGTLIKPRMRTLRMVLYQGGGAGGDRFAPPVESDSLCECVDNASDQLNGNSDQCGSICRVNISLSELENHKLTLHSDGSVHLDRTVHLHPDSSLWMMVDFDEAYLPFQKFPADANRGVDAFPSRATFIPVSVQPKPSLRASKALPHSITLYSPSLLLLPPVPDMSMPFNVISLSCTLWAFVLGSLLNILVRRGTESIKREFTGEKEKRPLEKLKDKLQEKVGKLKDMLKGLKNKPGVKQITEPEEVNEENAESPVKSD